MCNAAILCILLCVTSPAFAQLSYPPEMPGADVEAYHTSDDVDLNIYIFKPDNFSPRKRYPAAIFFFGGGWRRGSPEQFLEQSKYLASRGMFALVADYRVADRNGAKVTDCLSDAKAAIRWTRANAKRLGIAAQRFVACGGSAGGHLAAATGLVPGFEHDDQDMVEFDLALSKEERDRLGITREQWDDIQLPLVGHVRIKRLAESLVEEERGYNRRPMVMLTVCMGRRAEQIEVNLTDRSDFSYPLLIGADALKRLGAVVDPSLKMTAGSPRCTLDMDEQLDATTEAAEAQ